MILRVDCGLLLQAPFRNVLSLNGKHAPSLQIGSTRDEARVESSS